MITFACRTGAHGVRAELTLTYWGVNVTPTTPTPADCLPPTSLPTPSRPWVWAGSGATWRFLPAPRPCDHHEQCRGRVPALPACYQRVHGAPRWECVHPAAVPIIHLGASQLSEGRDAARGTFRVLKCCRVLAFLICCLSDCALSRPTQSSWAQLSTQCLRGVSRFPAQRG